MLEAYQIEKFWSKVNKALGLGPNGDCWEWTGGWKNKKEQYGGFYLKQINNTINCHKLSFILYHNFELDDIPDCYCIRHTCNNPKCVNPKHLKLGTYQDNSNDRIIAGNSGKGVKNGKNKFNNEQIKEIRKLWLSGQYTQPALARQFDTTQGTIYKIVMNISYSDGGYQPVNFRHSEKISEQQVEEIRNLRKSGLTIKEIMIRFPIGQTQIYNIIRREQRKEVK